MWAQKSCAPKSVITVRGSSLLCKELGERPYPNSESHPGGSQPLQREQKCHPSCLNVTPAARYRVQRGTSDCCAIEMTLTKIPGTVPRIPDTGS